MRRRLALMIATVATSALALPAAASAAPDVRDSRRVIVYYQKHYQSDPTRTGYISALPLLIERTGVDVVNLAAIHMNTNVLNLNDDPPSDPMYDRMWDELHQMHAAGIAVIGMIGGAQNDTWPNLQSDFATQYPRLRDLVQTYGLDGIDLDTELDSAQMSQGLRIDVDTVVDVIDALRADFGPDFLITASPVMSEFGSPDENDPDADPSPDGQYGVDVNELYRQRGSDIAWFNMQAYCGHGDPTPDDYNEIIRYQREKGAGIPPEKLVIAAITDPDNCTAGGWVPIPELTAGLRELTATYPQFGGIAGWEYFNSQPDGPSRPWRWATTMRAALDGTSPDPSPSSDAVPQLPATGQDAFSLAIAGAVAVAAVLAGVGVLGARRLRRG
ncbi:LPXTG cell wall anchor domain-containing protein [Microbacterium sp. SORGH_AS_0888]|uniref:LPXTG cell wall anchor domain-containing protein n=1 Tax=Microbacterium sp. SORGH_AS_0888 TaxID=3041791 RepID=UPI002782DC50|nr:glycosyl hydrolase family 18 protein [Microbacterium sp. SORGH_AS_0888]MDQ1130892.1 LPXTG-motif cell wall-anchored protein [Microbacterium sp. SORGH_AS_0888]